MSEHRFALVAISLSLCVTLRLVSESFVSYAGTVTAREMQQHFQTNILCLGSLLAFLQLIAAILLSTGKTDSKSSP